MTDGLLNDDSTNYFIDVSQLHAIIFDLGEVLVDLDTTATTKALTQLLQLEASHVFTFEHQTQLFTLFEKGLISSQEFRTGLKSLALNGSAISDSEIDNAWNAMLLDAPQKKLDVLINLKKQLRVLALSNTNTIHIEYVNAQIKKRNGNNDCLENYFHHAYYSHNMHMRKPDKEIYERLLHLENLSAQKVLFIDDRIENIKTARDLGMQTFHMTHPEQFYKLFTL